MKKTAALFLSAGVLFLPVLRGEETLFDWKCGIDGETISVTAEVAKDSYLYKESTVITITPAAGVRLLTEPPSVKHTDDSGETQVYQGPGTFLWKYSTGKSKGPWKAEISFQGCKSAGSGSGAMCLMPEKKSFSLVRGRGTGVKSDGKNIAEKKNDVLKFPSYTIVRRSAGYKNPREFAAFLQGKAEEKGLSDLFGSGNVLLMLLAVFLGGFALNLTPCVLPMIPVNLAIIGAGGKTDRPRKEKILRGCVYGLGIALAYGVLGAAAVLTGSTLGAVDSHWLFQAAVALIFFFLALSMFDVFLLDMSRWRSRLKLPSAAGLAGIFFLGVVAALLAGACVAPVVAAALLEASEMYNNGNPFGLLLLFVLGLGMALPWPVAAAGIAILPKPGKWMKYVKILFGILILVLACRSAILSFSLYRSSSAKFGESRARSGKSVLSEALAQSGKTGKMVLVDFRADWCNNCLEMEKKVFPDPAVAGELEKFLFVKFDATDMQSEEVKAVLKEFDIKGLPSFVILQGKRTGPAEL